MAKTTLEREEIEQAAIALTQSEVNEWQDATAFVTEDIAYNMRNMVRTFRKNYFGIFDKPFDSMSGRKKTWVPLTESTVDAVRKNIDLDTKDINFRAKRREAIGLTQLVRDLVRVRLDQMHFGEILDRLITNTAIDGTGVWKTYITNTGGKKAVQVRWVDTLNIFIDPVAESIQDATIIERAALEPDQIQMMDGWENTSDMFGSDQVSRNEKDLSGTTGVDLIGVYERWGLAPKSWITGNADDTELVQTQIVVSGLDDGNSGPRVHLLKENKQKDSDGMIIKPYEEFWYSRVPGRWYGRGPAEKVMFLQVWLNTLVNIRINRSYVSQLGIFKVRKGSGITPQMMSGLTANGVVVLNNMDDLQQLPVQEASQASYNDEEVVKQWARQVTSTFESAVGEQLPATTPATNAIIQSRASQSQFFLVKEGCGLFLQRWMKRHFIPLYAQTLTTKEITRITGESNELREMDKRVANKLVEKKAKALLAEGRTVDPQSLIKERNRIMEKLATQGGDRFINLMEKPDLTDYDVQVFVTNEEFDKGVMAQNLTNVFQTVAAVPGTGVEPAMVLDTIYDLMGLNMSQYQSSEPAPQPQPVPQGAVQAPAVAAPAAAPSQQQFTQANIPV